MATGVVLHAPTPCLLEKYERAEVRGPLGVAQVNSWTVEYLVRRSWHLRERAPLEPLGGHSLLGREAPLGRAVWQQKGWADVCRCSPALLAAAKHTRMTRTLEQNAFNTLSACTRSQQHPLQAPPRRVLCHRLDTPQQIFRPPQHRVLLKSTEAAVLEASEFKRTLQNLES